MCSICPRGKFGLHVVVLAGVLLLNARHSSAQTVQPNLPEPPGGDALRHVSHRTEHCGKQNPSYF